MNINKNISVWRGDTTPPTKYHLWLKSDGTLYTFDGYQWVKLLDQIPLARIDTNGLMSKEDKSTLDNIRIDYPHYKDDINDKIDLLKLKDSKIEENLNKEVERANDAELNISDNLTEHISDKANPHNVTKVQVGLSDVTNDAQVKRSEMGKANGVATLDNDGKIQSTLLPSYVDDILEYNTLSDFPVRGETGKIYVAKNTNLTYRWSGTLYVEISKSIALGTTSTTAYPGDKGLLNSNDISDIKERLEVLPMSVTNIDIRNSEFDEHLWLDTLYSDGISTTTTLFIIPRVNISEDNPSNGLITPADKRMIDKAAYCLNHMPNVLTSVEIDLNNTINFQSKTWNPETKGYDGDPVSHTITPTNATTTIAGYMSAADKLTLDNLSNVNVVTTDTVLTITANKTFNSNVTANKVIIKDGTSSLFLKADGSFDSNTYATTTLLSNKVDKVSGKGLSTNDYTTTEKNKLAGIAANANNYSLPVASSTTRGGVKLGYVENDKNYPVEAASEKLFVNVPWISTTASSTLNGLMSSSDKDKLDGITITNYYTKTEIDATKANIDDLSNVLAEEVPNLPTLQAINDITREELKKDLFIDMWNKACGSFGTYNAETGYFELNGLTDITYDQAVTIYNEGYTKYPSPSTISNKCRTNILAPTNNGYQPSYWDCNLSHLALLADHLEVLRISDSDRAVQANNVGGMLFMANKLKKVIGTLSLSRAASTNYTNWAACSNLEELFMSYLKTNLALGMAPKLNLQSFQFLVNNATNTSPITVKVHPDVYAKITNTDADIAPYFPVNYLNTKNILGAVNATVIENGVQIASSNTDTYWYVKCSNNEFPHESNRYKSLKVTVSVDVEGLHDGEIYKIGITDQGTNRYLSIDHNGRNTVQINLEGGLFSQGYIVFDDFGRPEHFSGIKFTNFKLELGWNDNSQWSEYIDNIPTDLQEKVQWAELRNLAAARQISFVTA